MVNSKYNFKVGDWILHCSLGCTKYNNYRFPVQINTIVGLDKFTYKHNSTQGNLLNSTSKLYTFNKNSKLTGKPDNLVPNYICVKQTYKNPISLW